MVRYGYAPEAHHRIPAMQGPTIGNAYGDNHDILRTRRELALCDLTLYTYIHTYIHVYIYPDIQFADVDYLTLILQSSKVNLAPCFDHAKELDTYI